MPIRITLAVLALAGLSLPAFAQDAARFDDLDADRLNPEQILIDFEYDGGACEAVASPELGDVTDGTLAVTFTATSTGEVCTMQMVEHDIKWAISGDEAITHVAVTLIGTNGETVATETTRVDND